MPGVPTLEISLLIALGAQVPLLGLAIVTAFSQRKKHAPYPVGRPATRPAAERPIARPPALENFQSPPAEITEPQPPIAILQAPESAASATEPPAEASPAIEVQPAEPSIPAAQAPPELVVPSPSAEAEVPAAPASPVSPANPPDCRPLSRWNQFRLRCWPRPRPNRCANQSVSALACGKRARTSLHASAPQSPAARVPTRSTKVLRKL